MWSLMTKRHEQVILLDKQTTGGHAYIRIGKKIPFQYRVKRIFMLNQGINQGYNIDYSPYVTILTLSMLRLLLSKAQGRRGFGNHLNPVKLVFIG